MLLPKKKSNGSNGKKLAVLNTTTIAKSAAAIAAIKVSFFKRSISHTKGTAARIVMRNGVDIALGW